MLRARGEQGPRQGSEQLLLLTSGTSREELTRISPLQTRLSLMTCSKEAASDGINQDGIVRPAASPRRRRCTHTPVAAKIKAGPAGADRGASLLQLGMLLDGLVNTNDTTALHVRCYPLLLRVTE